ncbi:MAG TPA: hypothetical protein ENI11_04985 [Actinobacteria bacterium]|nr:hypothetical protein [Actinomycetota bacterium]
MASLIQKTVDWFRIVRQRYIVRFFLSILFVVVSVYSALFFLLMPAYEDKSVTAWEAVYWTINRLTTTGELSPSLVYTSAPIQLLSVTIQISGLAFFFAAFPLAIIPALERRILGEPAKFYWSMHDHIIVCGYNDMVESLIDELVAAGTPFVVIDNDIGLVRELQQKLVPAIYGDPMEEETLISAGACDARYIIANREDEEDNAKIVLVATGICKAKVIAVIDDISHAHYFEYAGATEVLSPKKLLGVYLAEKATASWRDELFGAGELVSDFFIIELPIYPGSPFDGLTLRESSIPERCGAALVGIWHRGNLELEPGPDSRISAENVLVAVGQRQQLLGLQGLTRTIELKDVSERLHSVIAGFGDVGRAIKDILDSHGLSSTIIDPRAKTGTYLQGDATDEGILHEAKIEKAASFFAASHVDRDNIFSTLIARRMSPDIHIFARANSRESIDKLYRAGADFVFSLSTIAAQMMAEMLVGDSIVTLSEGLKVLSVPVGSSLAGKTIAQSRIRTRTGCTVIVASLLDGEPKTNPRASFVLETDTTIVVLGNAKQIRKFKKRFA